LLIWKCNFFLSVWRIRSYPLFSMRRFFFLLSGKSLSFFLMHYQMGPTSLQILSHQHQSQFQIRTLLLILYFLMKNSLQTFYSLTFLGETNSLQTFCPISPSHSIIHAKTIIIIINYFNFLWIGAININFFFLPYQSQSHQSQSNT